MSEKKKKILVIEDEEALRRIMVDRLNEEADYEVLEAVDGKAGLETANAEKPDLLLLDVYMPRMDGLSVLRELKKEAWAEQIKVIFLTNSNDLSKVAHAQEFGVFDYLIKADWDIEAVIEKVRQKINEVV